MADRLRVARPVRFSPRGAFDAELERLRASGRLYLLAPLFMALGILIYFNVPHEPSTPVLVTLCAASAWLGRHALVGRAATMTLIGLTAPALHALYIGDAPRSLPDGPRKLTTVIERIENRPSGAVVTARILSGVRGVAKVRLNSRNAVDAHVGQAAVLVATLSYPPGPVRPGHYDHARRLHFENVAAIGTLIAGPWNAVDVRTTPVDAIRAGVASVRSGIAGRIEDVLDGDTAGLAVALLTGDRDGLSETVIETMRASGLAHVLAISGMHMGLFCTTLFLILRTGLTLAGGPALKLPVKKIAALGALCGGAFYLVVSGAQIATQRAYIMAAIVCLAVLLDRPALTLRNVATAAIIVLLVSPESLLGASFQMSFAATVALIAVYERWTNKPGSDEAWLAVPGRQALGLFVTSLTAGLATAPYAAFHFNRIATYGLAANLAAMPFVTILIMPAGLVSLLAMPLGLEALPLTVMGYGLDGLLGVAARVSSWPDAMRAVPSPAPGLLAFLSAGLFLLALSQGPVLRSAACCLIAIGLAHHASRTEPLLRIAENGRTLAVQAPRPNEARTIIGARHSKFTQARWIEETAYRGIPAAGEGRGVRCDAERCVLIHERGAVVAARSFSAVQHACLSAHILVTPKAPPEDCPAPSLVLGEADMRAGSLDVFEREGGYLVRPATPRDRPWRRPRVSR